MKRSSNDRKPGKKRLAFHQQAIRELKPSDLEQGLGAGAATAPAADTDMGTLFLNLPIDGFLC